MLDTKPTRPVLRWHGGKWVLATWIIGHFPSHRVYTESYGGAGSVLLKKPRCFAEIWNDIDDEVVILFRVLSDPKLARKLRKALYLTPYSRAELELSYKLADNDFEIARRLVVRCYMGFGSSAQNRNQRTGFRSGSNRSHTTPAHDWANYSGALAMIIRRLRGVVIEKRDAVKILLQHDGKDTLHYVDPPYVHSTRGSGNDVRHRYKHELFNEDHENLARILKRLTGMVVLSGYRGPLYEKLYSGWQTFERKALADGAYERTEVLWLNDAASKALAAGKEKEKNGTRTRPDQVRKMR